ncbi:MAG: hypothetical protein JWO03_174 [Bacteroidetes bacterium]|nr:hypothetical protein [Bacteroidota bacterium]
MKYFTLLLCLLSAGMATQAQIYIDITQSDTSLYWFAAINNTSVNGTQHSEVAEHFTGGTRSLHGITYAETDNGLQRRYMRSDVQHRVYGLDPNDTVETLYYAFDALVGDTIRFHGFIGDSSLQSHDFFYAVDSIDSIDINGVLRKEIYVSTDIGTGTPGLFFRLAWIEGIGEKYTGLRSVFQADIYDGYSFCGIHQGTAYIYSVNNSCYDLLGINGLPDSYKLRVYPTPADDILTVENNTSERLGTYTIVDASGQVAGTGDMPALTGGVLPIGGLSAGVYFLVVRDDMGNTYKQKVIRR